MGENEDRSERKQERWVMMKLIRKDGEKNTTIPEIQKMRNVLFVQEKQKSTSF